MIPHQLVILLKCKIHELDAVGQCQVPPKEKIESVHAILEPKSQEELQRIVKELNERLKEWVTQYLK